MSKPTDTLDRTIRVFVSSTFRDMQAERDELVLRIFPQLRRLCEARGVTWGEVDLRWGIPDEQQAEGKVLPICLEEIKRYRPYFIGLLGERYGWIPDAIPQEIVEQEPWLREHVHGKKSVTELEILHGVLNNPQMADHSFFYFRHLAFVEKMAENQKIDVIPENARRAGDVNLSSFVEDPKKDFISENPESAEKLKRLKDGIRTNHRNGTLKHAPREDYADTKALGELVLADFTALIDTLYPVGEQPTPLERERMDHEAFARSRAKVYIGRQEYFDRLDAHVAGDPDTSLSNSISRRALAPGSDVRREREPDASAFRLMPGNLAGSPLIVLDESGSGKSALLANWFLSRFPPSTLDAQPSTSFALLHFIGGSPDSANATGILRRIMLELKQDERFDLPDDVPAQPEQIREAFPNWLAQTAGRGRVVLVLDALNQLEDVDNAPDLGWLPRVFPKNCRVILSTLPGRSLTAVERSGWLAATPPLEVQPLYEAERRRLVKEFLAQYTRDLGRARTNQLVPAKQTANPLYLRALLDELRQMGAKRILCASA